MKAASAWEGMNTITASLRPLLEGLKHVADTFPIVRGTSSARMQQTLARGSFVSILGVVNVFLVVVKMFMQRKDNDKKAEGLLVEIKFTMFTLTQQ